MTETLYPAMSLEQVIMSLRSGRRSGKLVINFSNGSPAGHVEFIERKEDL